MNMPVWSSVSFTSTGRKIKQILDRYPGNKGNLYVTSSRRPASAGSHHQSGNAVDIGYHWYNDYNGGNALAKWLNQFSGDLLELIHTPSGNFVKNGRRVGAYAASTHKDHIHVAMTSAQADRILRRIGGGGSSSSGGSAFSSVRSTGSQQKEVNLAGYTPKLEEDGVLGPLTTAGVKWYQKKIGTSSDGKWGPATEAAHRKYKDSNKSSSGSSSSPSSSSSSSSSSGKVSVDGVEGPETISELQRRLNVKR